jgi:hypothetical protein
MLAEATKRREILMMAAFRVLIATVCTVAGMIGTAFLAKMLSFSSASIITFSVIAGICGFIVGVYWTMTYLVKSGYSANKSTKK